jgi:hypothetical protein
MNLCDTCRFHDALQKSCRKGPPTLVMIPTMGNEMRFGGAWPPARDVDWCGEHKRGVAITVLDIKSQEEKANV